MNHKGSRLVVFAGGGTAGHIEPAIAVARAWKAKYPDDEEVFLGTEQGLEGILVPASGFVLRTIPKVVAPRKISLSLFRFPFNLYGAVKRTGEHLAGATIVIGFGGYVSAPMYVAARLKGIPIVIHEANAKVGWANRLGSVLTSHLACGQSVRQGRFSKATVTGIPLRSTILEAAEKSRADWKGARDRAKEQLQWNLSAPTLLVVGGSQGSTFINTEVERAIPELLLKGVQILHSLGSKNELPSGSSGYNPVPYIDDMATAYLGADIVIARSGAMTCAEFATLGKFALFLPLPVGNGEQARNADYLISQGRAKVLAQKDFSAQWLLSHFDELLEMSRSVGDAGLTLDLGSVEKIINVMESALGGVRG